MAAQLANIVVTGGAGYLGSVLVPTLLASGYRVTVVDNFLYRQNSLAACCADPNFSVVNGDVRDEGLSHSQQTATRCIQCPENRRLIICHKISVTLAGQRLE